MDPTTQQWAHTGAKGRRIARRLQHSTRGAGAHAHNRTQANSAVFKATCAAPAATTQQWWARTGAKGRRIARRLQHDARGDRAGVRPQAERHVTARQRRDDVAARDVGRLRAREERLRVEAHDEVALTVRGFRGAGVVGEEAGGVSGGGDELGEVGAAVDQLRDELPVYHLHAGRVFPGRV